jgi:hypothetical protein
MMHGFPSSQDRITAEVLASYMAAVETVSADAVGRSCQQFLAGKVEGRNNAFMPSAAELAANARAWDEAIATVTANQELRKLNPVKIVKIGAPIEPPLESAGLIKIDIGGVMTDVSTWTLAEKEEALRTGTLPASRNQITTDATRRIDVKPRTMQ